jgi:hypothetical protein
MILRLVIVLALVAVLAVVGVRRRRHPALSDVDLGLLLPTELLGETEHTWVVFSTPYCATCGPVESLLRERFPTDEVRRAEVADWTETVHALGVRRAPTVVRVDRQGAVELQLAGPEAIREHLAVSSLV